MLLRGRIGNNIQHSAHELELPHADAQNNTVRRKYTLSKMRGIGSTFSFFFLPRHITTCTKHEKCKRQRGLECLLRPRSASPVRCPFHPSRPRHPLADAVRIFPRVGDCKRTADVALLMFTWSFSFCFFVCLRVLCGLCVCVCVRVCECWTRKLLAVAHGSLLSSRSGACAVLHLLFFSPVPPFPSPLPAD